MMQLDVLKDELNKVYQEDVTDEIIEDSKSLYLMYKEFYNSTFLVFKGKDISKLNLLDLEKLNKLSIFFQRCTILDNDIKKLTNVNELEEINVVNCKFLDFPSTFFKVNNQELRLVIKNSSFNTHDQNNKINFDQLTNSQISEVYIDESEINYDLIQFVLRLKNLILLSIQYCNISNKDENNKIKLIVDSPTIEHLAIYLQIKYEIPELEIINCVSLLELFTNLDIKKLKNCENLKYLGIVNPKIEYSKEYFSKFPNLISLSIRDNNLDTFRYEWVEDLKLQQFNIKFQQIWKEYFKFRKKGYNLSAIFFENDYFYVLKSLSFILGFPLIIIWIILTFLA